MSKKNNHYSLVAPGSDSQHEMIRTLSKFFQFGNAIFSPLKGQQHDQLSKTQCGIYDGLKAKGWRFVKELR